MNIARMCRRPLRRFVAFAFTFTVLTSAYFVIFYIKQNVGSEQTKRLGGRYTAIEEIRQRLSDSAPKLNPNSQKFISGQACVHPQLELWHPALKKYFQDPPPLQCAEEENWVYVDNGTFRISPNAIKNHGEIECSYMPRLRGNDDFSVVNGKTITGIRDGTPLSSDFFLVLCTAADKKIYKNIHSSIAFDANLQSRSAQTPMPKHAMGLDVMMFGFDSTSRMTWMRNLPKTHDYFTKSLGGLVLEGYNIVGDGTPQALLPILTGHSEPELPEARRGKSSAKTVDGHPWLWKDFKKAGYVTQWAEDGASVGTFTYRMLGFKHQPVDHYMRPFYLQAEKQYSAHKRHCLGSVPRHLNMINWARDFFHMYANKPKFSFIFHSEFTHGGFSEVRVVDDDLKAFLESLEEAGFLNSTILILMADHGARFHAVRQTVQGKYEERMPYFGFRFPPWFERKYPDAMRNFRLNTNRLTTPYDIHETLANLLEYTGSKTVDVKQRGISLFNEIPNERTCSDAGIEAHWCACLNWRKVSPNDKAVKAVAEALAAKINFLTETERTLCETIQVENITSANMFIPNDHLLRFKKSKDHDGRVADLSDTMATSEVLYQISVITTPGGATFEATVKVDLRSERFLVNEREISRTNKYGSHPHCVMERLPHLRPFCYCKEQIS